MDIFQLKKGSHSLQNNRSRALRFIPPLYNRPQPMPSADTPLDPLRPARIATALLLGLAAIVWFHRPSRALAGPALRLIPDLVRLGVELIEQPFPAHRLDQLRWLQERSELPLVADESAVTIQDLDGLVGVVNGVNVKLAKCGGPGPALRMLTRARELGFKTFLGCMEETSLGIAASAHVAILADWIDLDGCLLISGDPFEGLELGPDCRWQLTEAAGLGIRRRAV